jgi:hypothetical protein
MVDVFGWILCVAWDSWLAVVPDLAFEDWVHLSPIKLINRTLAL